MLLMLMQAAVCHGRSEGHPEFFELHIIDRHERFRTLPVDEQVDIYLEAMRRHPPDIAYAHDIAETNGQEAVPALLSRLRKEKSEALQCDLVHVLEIMAASYGASFDGETVAAVTEVVRRMKYKSFRSRAEKSLATIRSAVQKPVKPMGDVTPNVPSSRSETR